MRETSAELTRASASPIALLAAAIRREREQAQLSLSEVARRSGLAKSTLSQLEAAVGNPSLETLWALSTALGIPVGRLMSVPDSSVRLVRVGEGTPTKSEQADYAVVLLSDDVTGVRRDIYRVTAQPGSVRRSRAHPPGTVEHVILCSGEAMVGPATEPVHLSSGDYMTYPADVAHVFEALEPNTVAVMVMEHP